jgi:hypothetical protein
MGEIVLSLLRLIKTELSSIHWQTLNLTPEKLNKESHPNISAPSMRFVSDMNLNKILHPELTKAAVLAIGGVGVGGRAA